MVAPGGGGREREGAGEEDEGGIGAKVAVVVAGFMAESLGFLPGCEVEYRRGNERETKKGGRRHQWWGGGGGGGRRRRAGEGWMPPAAAPWLGIGTGRGVGLGGREDE